jgi:hypothetical protein
MNVNLGLLTLSALLLLAPVASASPPPGSTDNCLGGGYNPDALANVCFGDGPSTPDHTGTVGTTPGPCVIGETCVPIPTYDPNGGTTIPSVTVPTVSYVDVKALYLQCEAPSSQLYGDQAARCAFTFANAAACGLAGPGAMLAECVINGSAAGNGAFSINISVRSLPNNPADLCVTVYSPIAYNNCFL